MPTEIFIWGSLVLLVVVLVSILGAIDGRERLLFVGGLGLFILAHLVDLGIEALGMILAVIGILLAVSATIPLLRQPT